MERGSICWGHRCCVGGSNPVLVPSHPRFWIRNQRFLGLLCRIAGFGAKWQLASIYKGNQRFLKLQFLYFIGMDWLWIECQNWQFSLGIDNPGGNFYTWTTRICGKPLKNVKNIQTPYKALNCTQFPGHSHISADVWASIYKGNQRFLKLQFLYFIGMDWLWIEYPILGGMTFWMGIDPILGLILGPKIFISGLLCTIGGNAAKCN